MSGLFKITAILFLTSLFTACAAQPAAQTGPIHLTMKDAGTTVNLKPGDNLVIELEGNPSTGYTWQPASPDLKIIQQLANRRLNLPPRV